MMEYKVYGTQYDFTKEQFEQIIQMTAEGMDGKFAKQLSPNDPRTATTIRAMFETGLFPFKKYFAAIDENGNVLGISILNSSGGEHIWEFIKRGLGIGGLRKTAIFMLVFGFLAFYNRHGRTDIGEVFWVVTDQRYARRGINTHLQEHILQYLKKQCKCKDKSRCNCTVSVVAFADNDKSIGTHQKAGYKIVKRYWNPVLHWLMGKKHTNEYSRLVKLRLRLSEVPVKRINQNAPYILS